MCFWGIFTRASPKTLAKKHFRIVMPSQYFRELLQMKCLVNPLSHLLKVWEDFFKFENLVWALANFQERLM